MEKEDTEKFRWLDEARKIASDKSLEFQDEGDSLIFWIKRDFSWEGTGRDLEFYDRGGGWLNMVRQKQGPGSGHWYVTLSFKRVELCDELVGTGYEWGDAWNSLLENGLGYVMSPGIDGYKLGKKFEDPKDAVEEVSTILSDLILNLFDPLERIAISIEALWSEAKKLIERGGVPRVVVSDNLKSVGFNNNISPIRSKVKVAKVDAAVIPPGRKVAKLGIKREKGWIYFIDKQGDISRKKMARGDSSEQIVCKAEVVVKVGLKREDGYLFFIDKEGDISRAKIRKK